MLLLFGGAPPVDSLVSGDQPSNRLPGKANKLGLDQVTADHPPVGGATGCSYKKPELKDALCASDEGPLLLSALLTVALI